MLISTAIIVAKIKDNGVGAVLADHEIIARSDGWVYVGRTDCSGGRVENKGRERCGFSHFGPLKSCGLLEIGFF